MVSPPLGLAQGGEKRGPLSWGSRAGLREPLKQQSAGDVLSRSQDTRPGARGSGPGRGGRGFGLRPILQARVKFMRPAPFGAAGRGQAGTGTPRERLRAGFSPKPSAAALPSERG